MTGMGTVPAKSAHGIQLSHWKNKGQVFLTWYVLLLQETT